MKAVIKPELKVILERYEIDPSDEDQVWSAHGTLVLYHKAYERIAAREKIVFDPPAVVNAIMRDGQFSIAVIVTGRLGDQVAWSFGEASDMNYRGSGKQALYPYAIAEKRGIDRVIAKLIGISGWIYSEEEADAFKAAKPATQEVQPQEAKLEGPKQEPNKLLDWHQKVIAALANAKTAGDVDALLERCKPGLEQAKKDDVKLARDVMTRFTARKIILSGGIDVVQA